MLNNLYNYLESSPWRHVIFWVVVFMFALLNGNGFYSGYKEILTVFSIRVSMQIVIAYLTIKLFIPHLLNRSKKLFFLLSILITLAVCYAVCTAILLYYLEPTYPETYISYMKRFSSDTFITHFLNLREFLSKSLYLLYPTILLLAIKLYKEKQDLLKLNEQKRTAELTALKNQLNPHFLFNTLNNLYALAFKKSDDTTKVIEKLSNILDYILYRCNDDYVALEKEIELIENYLSLEKIRYGDRVTINFSKQVTGKEKIAPLLLLTFIENAFKHGVAEELEEAKVNIAITKNNGQLEFLIENSKPETLIKPSYNDSIGLKNIKKQLELLYPKAYNLAIDNSTSWYSANLKLQLI